MLIIILRTLQYSSTRAMDSFVLENCFAILSNMGPHIRNIHSHAAQRLVSLLDIICRRRKRLMERDGNGETETRLCGLILELLSVALRPQMLAHNLDLMYSILQKREVVDNLSIDADEELSEAATSLLSTINFFGRAVAKEQATLENALNTVPVEVVSDTQDKAAEDVASIAAKNDVTQAVQTQNKTSAWSSEVVMGILEGAHRQWYKRNATMLEPEIWMFR